MVVDEEVFKWWRGGGGIRHVVVDEEVVKWYRGGGGKQQFGCVCEWKAYYHTTCIDYQTISDALSSKLLMYGTNSN